MPVLAAEAGNVTISGQLVNKTRGGSSVADQVVTLKTSLNNIEISSATNKTQSDGRFSFDKLVTEPGYSYEITVTYQEGDYSSEALSFAANETAKSVEIVVYDSTTSSEAIRVDAAHTVIYAGQEGLEIMEVYLVSNNSDRTYIGSGEITTLGRRKTLDLPLPQGAKELQYFGELMGCCVVDNQEGFSDTMSIQPGSKEIAYSYKIDQVSGKFTLSRTVANPMASYALLITGEGIKVESDRLVAKGPVDINGTTFNQFSGADFAPGEVISASLSSSAASSHAVTLWVILPLAILAGAAGLVYMLRKRPFQPAMVQDDSAQGKEGLLLEMARLDDDFESGKIAEPDYRRLRAEKKAQLVKLMQETEQK
ncbi:MAG: hypothetical protein HW402_154 [Dehalococcoidales bacterium]|nr:hypothetical protein [Dehalococcoidales bacterium]